MPRPGCGLPTIVVVLAPVDLAPDFNAQDDGHGWAKISHASEPAAVQPGEIILAGNRRAQARVRILRVDADGQVHFEIL